MQTITLEEAEKAISTINQTIYDQLSDIDASNGYMDQIYLELHTNSYATVIKFLNVEIWSSEDDCRPYLDNSQTEYISLFDHLTHKVNQLIRTVKVVMA